MLQNKVFRRICVLIQQFWLDLAAEVPEWKSEKLVICGSAALPPNEVQSATAVARVHGGSLNEMFRVVSVGAIAWKNVETALSSVLWYQISLQ